jgi:hypothetical protein
MARSRGDPSLQVALGSQTSSAIIEIKTHGTVVVLAALMIATPL